MKVELFPFQKLALSRLRAQTADALGSYRRTHTPQIVSFTAPTGAGKTIVMSALIESIFFGDDVYPDQLDAIFVWLSDSPELNQQSKDKIDLKADKIRLSQCITIKDESFDQEMLEDGNIYFLNTQKLGRGSNLTKKGDRSYTIWETLSNTVSDKSDRLYFIIDEAHRGMQGRDAARATSIMQKFLKGSPEDGLPIMPVVIGMTATPERFNNLAVNTMSTTHRVVTTADEVRASGLLKDRIIITYPDTVNNDMAVLQAAADDWKHKWEHWSQYCFEQHYAYVNPVFIVQVQNGNGNQISATDLDDCLQKIEERTGERFQYGEVVHTFGQTNTNLVMNGIDVCYCEPSRIAEDRKIKVVFFKENLSTGWDCPRAETMMSFRHANDATYIAQLLGRMVRTPMQMHIMVDDVLNEVHLFLPYFNAETVNDVAEALQSTEGGNIPTDVYSESFSEPVFDTLTVRPRSALQTNTTPYQVPQLDGQQTVTDIQQTSDENAAAVETNTAESAPVTSSAQSDSGNPITPAQAPETRDDVHTSADTNQPEVPSVASDENEPDVISTFDREEVMKAINDAGLLTYDVRSVRISSYLHSLFALAHLFSQSQINPGAYNEIVTDIVRLIHNHIETLKETEKYSELATQVMQFKLNTQVFDVFGESVDNNDIHDLFTATDTDLDRQFRLAETKLGNEGVGIQYGRQYEDEDNPNVYKIDVIIYAADSECIAALNTYAKERFHQMNDRYRRRTTTLSTRFKKRYDDIVSDGDPVSKHNFTLPETIICEHNSAGRIYSNHLFVDNTGIATIALNPWEEGVLEEEAARQDFVCWIRNPSRKPWSLCIPYEKDNVKKPTYPDFIVIRKDEDGGYIIDILEPHDNTRTDNLGKVKGFAEYARQNPGVGRIQLIREGRDASNRTRFKRLDMSMSAVRDKVAQAMNDEELGHIFETDGFFM